MLAFHDAIIPMNSRSSRRLQIVVLAAGFSIRLGQPKALARVHGQSLLSRTLLIARGLDAASILVVVPPNDSRYAIAARAQMVTWAANPRRVEGLSSSVRRGLRAARYASAILFLPADLPYLKRRELARLIRHWRAAPRRLIARRLGDAGAIPLILPRWLYARASAVVGDIGLRQLIAQLPREQRVLVDISSAAVDVDTPQTLAAVRRRFHAAYQLDCQYG
jgi:molybdenum cofactor cytidylyltransferase